VRAVMDTLDLDCRCRGKLDAALERFEALESRRQLRGLILDARHQAERIGALLELVGELDTVRPTRRTQSFSTKSRCCSTTSGPRRCAGPKTGSVRQGSTCVAAKRADLQPVRRLRLSERVHRPGLRRASGSGWSP
jgi:hypothetical protein